jgi:hypothetical protein
MDRASGSSEAITDEKRVWEKSQTLFTQIRINRITEIPVLKT